MSGLMGCLKATNQIYIHIGDAIACFDMAFE